MPNSNFQKPANDDNPYTASEFFSLSKKMLKVLPDKFFLVRGIPIMVRLTLSCIGNEHREVSQEHSSMFIAILKYLDSQFRPAGVNSRRVNAIEFSQKLTQLPE